MNYKEFHERCLDFYFKNKEKQGYSNVEIRGSENEKGFYTFCVAQKKEWTLSLDYTEGEKKPYMLFENMGNGEPQRVYGYYTHLGHALNSMLKGSSFNDRKPIELY